MVKKIILNVLYRSGVLGLILKFMKPGSVVIFMVHGVEDPDDEGWIPSWQRHTRNHLEMALKVLSRYFDIVSLDDAVSFLGDTDRGDRGKSKKLVFTFDDGYRNNLLAAYPVLQKYSAPATFYLATGLVESREPYWIDRLDYLFQTLPDEKIPVNIGPVISEIDKSSAESYKKSYRNLRLRMKSEIRNDKELQAYINNFASKLEKKAEKMLEESIETDKWAAILSKDDLMKIPDDIDLGNHTVNHLRVDRLEEEDVVYELLESQRYIEENSDHKCRNFCYPNGSFCDRSAKIVEEQGFSSAVTTKVGSNQRGDDLFKLKRISLPFATSEASLIYQVIRNI